ncbi:transposase [Rhizobium beringeri]|uniref:Transposase n=1 Tax=Rhizobium beringeri TaxID=3019934 RepID=A0ABY1XPE9_9HYPH|nr:MULTISPECIES: transposase [Rhizobium]MBY5458051.1 transposase [Rhizobium leguminosarum]TBC71509.1 transposase [Rhizobium leguminosarum]TBE69427.1 transposase [Rhizobium beringeri]WSG74801.1 transposase [Rhizobium beringeri]WSH14996.1 transposase [Rhizobium beringeri]
MTDKDEDQELAMIAARAAEIKAGLNAAYSPEELRRPLSTRCVHALIAATTAATGAKLTALSARVAELEAGGVRYAGCYQRAMGYRKGSVITFAGAMWTALDDVPAGIQPGSNTALWQLSQKGEPRARKKVEGRQQ